MDRHAIGTPCSPYLSKPLRSLRAACVELAREHGLAAPPCGTCRLSDLCGPALLPVLLPDRLGLPAGARWRLDSGCWYRRPSIAGRCLPGARR